MDKSDCFVFAPLPELGDTLNSHNIIGANIFFFMGTFCSNLKDYFS